MKSNNMNVDDEIKLEIKILKMLLMATILMLILSKWMKNSLVKKLEKRVQEQI